MVLWGGCAGMKQQRKNFVIHFAFRSKGSTGIFENGGCKLGKKHVT